MPRPRPRGCGQVRRTLTAHLDALGVIGPGFTAAHTVWLDDDDMRQLADRGASVAHRETGAGVDSVLIDGRLVIHRRRVLTVDTAALRRDVEAAVERLRRVNEPARTVAEAAEKMVGAFCLGLTREPYPVDRFVTGAARE